MKKVFLVFLFPLLSNAVFAQLRADAEKLVDEGIAYHDKGDYYGAIAKYTKALNLDKNNLLALAEKAFSLLSLQKYDESILCCQKAIETHFGEKTLKNVYVTYGNDLDLLKKSDQAIDIYNEGLKQFPDHYQLNFNKGITQVGLKKYDEALLSFQNSVTQNPNHSSSHNAIGRLLNIEDKRIPSLLAYYRFLVIEPQGQRAKENLESVQKIMKGNIKQNGVNGITINIDPKMLGDTAAISEPKENNFTPTDLILSLDAALDLDKINSSKTEVEQFIRKFKTICASLKETKNNNYGFYWDYYVPYFTEMADKKLINPFAYIIFLSSGDADISAWFKSNQKEIDRFLEWSKNFSWKTN